MENRIENKFAELEQKGKKAFVSYFMGADPDPETTLELMHNFADNGVDIIELGLPFSDPMAEGPTIQKAAERVLKKNIKQKDVLEIVKKFRERDSTTPVILMGYYNPIFFHGIRNFVIQAKNAGIDGFIIVDLPPEEDEEFVKILNENGLRFIKLTTPTTDAKRAKRVLQSASGFVYYVSVAGVTGVKSADFAEVQSKVMELKKHTDLPICIGFGIKNTEQAISASKISEGIVIGSAFVKIIEENLHDKNAIIENSVKFVREIRQAIDSNN